MIRQLFFLWMMTISSLIASAEEFYINTKTGNDKNTGSQSQPLKTLGEAAKRINANIEKKATTVILSEGVYALTETALFNNDKFSSENRLTIRAEILPDDANWNPQTNAGYYNDNYRNANAR